MLLPALALALLTLPQPVSDAPAHGRVRLVSLGPGIVAGESTIIGIHFDLDPGWHIYSPSLNDAGQPPEIKLTLPDGWTSPKPRWPAPSRSITDIVLDHVYENSATILFVLEAPSTARPGSIQLKADLNYMICSRVCLFEKASASITLNVGVPNQPSHSPAPDAAQQKKIADDARLIRDADKFFPRTLANHWNPHASRWETTDPATTITPLSFPADAAHPSARHGFRVDGARKLEFYPAADSTPLPDLIKEGSVESDTILLTLAPSPSNPQTNSPAAKPDPAKPTTPLKGLLAVWKGPQSTPAYYSVE